MAYEDLTLFKGMDAFAREALVSTFDKKAFPAGSTLCHEGEKGDSMFILLSGTVEVIGKRRREGEQEQLAVLEAGQAIGEASLIGGMPRTATVKAKTAVEALVITPGTLNAFKKSKPDAALALYEGIIRQISARFRTVSDKKEFLSFWLS